MPQMAGYPDALCLPIPKKVECQPGRSFVVETVEIKMNQKRSQVTQALPYEMPEVTVVHMGSAACLQLISDAHQIHFLRQCFCTSLNVGLYVCASESEGLYTVIVLVSEEILDVADSAARQIVVPFLFWAE